MPGGRARGGARGEASPLWPRRVPWRGKGVLRGGTDGRGRGARVASVTGVTLPCFAPGVTSNWRCAAAPAHVGSVAMANATGATVAVAVISLPRAPSPPPSAAKAGHTRMGHRASGCARGDERWALPALWWDGQPRWWRTRRRVVCFDNEATVVRAGSPYSSPLGRQSPSVGRTISISYAGTRWWAAHAARWPRCRFSISGVSHVSSFDGNNLYPRSAP